jgi:hypothetical protein
MRGQTGAFMLVRHYVWPRVLALLRIEMLSPSKPAALTRGWYESAETAPLRYPGMLPPSYGGDVISAQTALRGVPPMLALLVTQQMVIQAGGNTVYVTPDTLGVHPNVG